MNYFLWSLNFSRSLKMMKTIFIILNSGPVAVCLFWLNMKFIFRDFRPKIKLNFSLQKRDTNAKMGFILCLFYSVPVLLQFYFKSLVLYLSFNLSVLLYIWSIVPACHSLSLSLSLFLFFQIRVWVG